MRCWALGLGTMRDELRSTLVILPVYNEERYLQEVIAGIRSHFDGDVLAVDDGSSDNTLSILKARDLTEIIIHEANMGYGAALIDGFDYAARKGYKYVLTIDGDGEHDPTYIPRFIDEVSSFGMVSGTRYHPQSPIITCARGSARLINEKIVEFINSELQISVTDAFCGYRAYQVDKLSRLRLDIRDYAFPLQIWVQASEKGFKVKEIPVPLIVTERKRSYDGPLASVESAIWYFKGVMLAEIRKSGRESRLF